MSGYQVVLTSSEQVHKSSDELIKTFYNSLSQKIPSSVAQHEQFQVSNIVINGVKLLPQPYSEARDLKGSVRSLF